MMEYWYIIRNNTQYGPYPTAQMLSMDSQGQLFASDFVRNAAAQAVLPLAAARQSWQAGAGAVSAFAPAPKKAAKKSLIKRLPRWARRVVTAAVCLIIAGIVGLGVWKLGDITGFWRDRQLESASGQWKKQAGFAQEEKEIRACLKDFADALEKNDIAAAIAFVHPDSQAAVQELLTAHADAVPDLVGALKTVEITYLTTDSGNYESIRTATVRVGKSTAGASASPGFTIVLVKIESGWAVVSL